ncbi:hypothetical protein FRC02_002916 [Tulasnella sp. 418]|nr:hypothetical protein FRC02_002916 [Tulasnella sp. 418]
MQSSAFRRRFAFLQGKDREPVPVVGHPPPHYAPRHYASSLPTTGANSSRDPPPSSYHPAQPSSSSSQIRRTPTLSEHPNITVPPPLQHAPNSYSSSTSDGSNCTNTSTAPTPLSSTSTITQTKLEGGNPNESSLVSTPTSTSISFVDTEEGTQVDEDRDQDGDQRRRSSDEEDDDPTVRIGGHSSNVQVAGRQDPYIPNIHTTKLPILERVKSGRRKRTMRNTTTVTPVRRDESPVASLKYFNGVWDRNELPNNAPATTKVQPRRRFTDEDEVDPGEETQDEVVYKGSSGSGLGGGSLMNVFGVGVGSMNGISAVGMARKAPNSGVASGLTGTGSSTSVSVNSALGR